MMDVAILITSDLHGRMPRLPESIAAESFYFDNGDTLFSAPPGTQAPEPAEKSATAMIASLAEMHCRAAVPGNHEFDRGRVFFEDIAQTSPFPWIAANLVDQTDRLLLLPECLFTTRQGRRIRFIGLLDPAACAHIPESDLGGCRILDPVTCLASLLNQVAPDELLIVSIHGGFRQGRQATSDDADHVLLETFPRIDLLITGHDHRAIITQQGASLALQPGAYGTHAALIEVEFTTDRPQLKARLENLETPHG
jgi:2',3'-cyclic-nucleotide 2'-phosphodiesterase / 3'-nucleotidase